MPDLLRIEDVARKLNVSMATVRRMIASRRLATVRPSKGSIRVRAEDLEAIITRPGTTKHVGVE
jgi:excisionase family DNA binding protein